MKAEGIVGPVGVLSDGTVPTVRLGKYQEQMVSELQPRYYEQAYRGNTFVGNNQAAQAVSVALATTYTGLCLSNPIGNTKNLVVLGASFALTVAPAAIASLHLIGGFSATTNVTHTTPIAAGTAGNRSTLLGATTLPTATLDSAATIPTPGYLLAMQGGFTAAALPSSPVTYLDVGGLIIVPPGGFVAIGALTAVTGFGTLVWDEINI